jgi:hypothetical protein
LFCLAYLGLTPQATRRCPSWGKNSEAGLPLRRPLQEGLAGRRLGGVLDDVGYALGRQHHHREEGRFSRILWRRPRPDRMGTCSPRVRPGETRRARRERWGSTRKRALVGLSCPGPRSPGLRVGAERRAVQGKGPAALLKPGIVGPLSRAAQRIPAVAEQIPAAVQPPRPAGGPPGSAVQPPRAASRPPGVAAQPPGAAEGRPGSAAQPPG